VGAFIGAILVWLAYYVHWGQTDDPGLKLAVFSTGPAIRNTVANLITEIIATFALVLFLLVAPYGDSPAIYACAAAVVVGIGQSLGGPTGYAINPARDLGPRIAHAILPITGKGGSDWSYSWVPVVGPIIGGLLAGWVAIPLLPLLG